MDIPKTPEEFDQKSLEAFNALMDRLVGINAPIFWESADRIAKRVGSKMGRIVRLLAAMNLESPIEGLFAMHWLTAELERPEIADLLLCQPHMSLHSSGELLRPDFVVVANCYPFNDMTSRIFDAGIVVELDGHEFHERTKQQVRTRNHKDRLIQALGFAVCHFSGSEIVGDPDACISNVLVLAEQRGQFALGREAQARRATDLPADRQSDQPVEDYEP